MGLIKPRLTLDQPAKLAFSGSPSAAARASRNRTPLPYARSLGVFTGMTAVQKPVPTFRGSCLEGPNRPPRWGAKTVDQRLRAIERRKARLDVTQPSQVFLIRLGAQGSFSVFELLM